MNLQNAPIFAYAEKAASERHTNSAILENVNRALKMPFKLNFSSQNRAERLLRPLYKFRYSGKCYLLPKIAFHGRFFVL